MFFVPLLRFFFPVLRALLAKQSQKPGAAASAG